jgi:FixJ family two-component response regulator
MLLDLKLPALGGLRLQDRLRTALPVILVSGYGTLDLAVAAMKAGATDFLSKPIPESVLLEAIERALERARTMFERRAECAEIQSRADQLTPREREVTAQVVDGYLNKQIAGELGAAEKTIKIHRGRVMDKMNAHSLAELVRLARQTQTRSDRGRLSYAAGCPLNDNSRILQPISCWSFDADVNLPDCGPRAEPRLAGSGLSIARQTL